MAEIINIQNINPNTFNLQNYSLEDNALIFSTTVGSVFDPNIDGVEYFIYNLNGVVIYQNVSNYPSYYINNNIITLTPEENLKNAGYNEGTYNTVYNFIHPKLGSNSNDRYFISQISSDRTEIRLDTTKIPNDVLITSSLELINDINNSKPSYYDFYLNFGNNQLVIANNALLDNPSGSTNPTVLIKLYEALPQQFTLKNELWVVTKVADSVAYNINITNTFDVLDNNIYLKGPNTNLNIKDQINNSTDYINLSNLYSNNNSQGTGSFQYQLNSLLAETGIEINVDYSDYSNFIHFSSAQTRLENFYYKLTLIEKYQVSASLSSGTSTNYYVSSSNIIWQNKIDEIITGFDSYEYFLYYESSSTCWPKSNINPPYNNVLTTSVTGQAWLVSQSLVAETYDLQNNNALIYAIPSYILEDLNNSQFELFVEMVGQMFDSIFVYLQDVTNKYNSDNRLSYGVSKELVADILRDMGIKIYQNNFSSDDLYSALIGFTPSGSLYNLPFTTTQLPVPENSFLEYINTYVTASATGSLIPTEDINFETYKRIYANLPYLLKKKGSLDGIRSLITLYGIPDTILRVNEFGGQDKNNNTADFWQNTYNYSLLSNASSSNAVYIPFQNLNTNFGGEFPRSIELRFKPGLLPSSSIKYSQSIISETGNTFTLVLEYTGSGYTTASYNGGPVDPYYQYATLKFGFQSDTASIYLPFYNGEWWSVLITANTTTNTAYTLYAGSKTQGYNGGIAYEASASFTNTFFWNTLSNTQLKLNHSGTFGGKNYTAFTGSYQEFRYYNNPLNVNSFESYVLDPYSIEGNTLNSSKDTLAFRLALGGELYTGSTSIHPAITGSSVTQSFTNFSTASFSGTTTWITNTETFYYNQVPAGIQNIISNKIQTQDLILPYSGSTNIPSNTVLSPYISVQQSNPLTSSYTTNVDYVEVGFSPQNEINEDINSSLGYFNLGEFIGDPRQISSSADSYPDLNALRDSYFSKYFKNYQEWDYIRLIEFFDNSLFKMIADWVPARTNLASGIIIKQHLLERNKYPVPQVDISSSIANVASGSTNVPFYQQNILFTGSVPMETITGSNGGTLPNMNGQTSSIILPGNYNTTVTQVWNGSNSGPLGVVPFTDSYQYEFFDGTFSGSAIIVTTQSLNSDNILLNNQAFYPTIADYQNLNVNTDNSFIPTSDTLIPFNQLQRNINYFNTSTYTYFPNFNTVVNISYYLSASVTTTGGTDYLSLALYENNNIISYTDLLAFNGSGTTNLVYPINFNNIPIKPGSLYTTRFVTGSLTGVSFSYNLLTNWTITTINPQVTGYPNDPNIYQQSTFPGNLELYSDYNAILNNVYSNRLSNQYLDVDYSQQGLLPVNQGVIISQSAVRAQVQDSNYTLARNINPRYVGSKNISAKYNTYTIGDSSYGKKAAIDTYVDYFVYFDWIGTSSPEYPGGAKLHLTYLIDIEGKAIPLTGDNTNIFTVSNIFVKGQTATVLPVVYSAGKPNPIANIVDGGALYNTILVKSGSGDIFNAGFSVKADVQNNFSDIYFISGSNPPTTSSLLLNNPISPNPNFLDFLITGSNFNNVTSYITIGDPGVTQFFNKSTDDLITGTINVEDTLLPIQYGDFIRLGNSFDTESGSLDYNWNNGFLYQIITTTPSNLIPIIPDLGLSSSLQVTPAAHSYPQFGNLTLGATASFDMNNAYLQSLAVGSGSFNLNGITINYTGSVQPNTPTQINVLNTYINANATANVTMNTINFSSSIAPYSSFLQYILTSNYISTNLIFDTTVPLGTPYPASILNSYYVTSGSIYTRFNGATNIGNQAFRIMRRVPKDNFVLIQNLPPYVDSGLLIPQNFNPLYDPYVLARKAGLIQ